jgi:hypothetical protein
MRLLCHVLLKNDSIKHMRFERKLPALPARRKHSERFTCVRDSIRRHLEEMSEIPGSRQKIEHFLLAGKELAASHRRTDRGLLVEDKDGRSSLCRSDGCLQSSGAGSCDDDFEAS